MPIVFHQKIKPDIVWAVWQITETESELLQNLHLSEQDLKAILSLKLPKRRLEKMACRKIVSFLLKSENVEIEYGEHGQPLLDGYHLSFSHSGDHAAAVISLTKRVGIDIEKISPKLVSAQGKFVSAKEMAVIDQNNPAEIAPYWCAKEAIYKLFPERKLDFLNDIAVDVKNKKAYLKHQEEDVIIDLFVEKIDDFYLVVVK